ncbi:MAG: AAA family ATPase [Candidatus Berkiella sp.]
MSLGPYTTLASTTIGVGAAVVAFISYQYPNETRALKNQALIELATSKWLSIGRLNDDLKYLIEFDQRMASVGSTLPEDRREALLVLITHYARLLNEGQSTQYLNNFRQGINSLFDLSIEFHEPIEDENKDALKQTVTQDYPQVEADINAYVDQLVQYINNPRLNPKPNPLLLVGPAGVGKTRLVEDILSKGLDLHVYRTSLANKKSEQLAGEEQANLCNKINEGVVFSAVVDATRSKKRAPIVIFLDDICAAFTKGGQKVEESTTISWLTELLDPELQGVTSPIYNRYGTAKHQINGIVIPAEDIILIAAANSTHFVLTEGLQRRLRSRIAFPPMTLEKKQEIAKSYSEELEQKAVQAVQDGTLDNRVGRLKRDAGELWSSSTECENELKKVRLTNEEKKFIEQLAKRDPYPGAGTMKDTINKWYAAKKAGSKFDVEAYYQRLEANSEDTLNSATFLPAFGAAKTASVDELAAALNKHLSFLDDSTREEVLKRARSNTQNK